MNLESEEKPMRREKFSSEQALAILGEQESGPPTAELCRSHGMHSEKLYSWQRKSMVIQRANVQKLRHLTDQISWLTKENVWRR